LAIETYRDVYKDVYGIRPRRSLEDKSVEEIEAMIDSLSEDFEEDDDSWLRNID